MSSEVIAGFVDSCLKKGFDQPLEIPAFHKEIWSVCTSKHRFVAIAAPRSFGKSTAITHAYVLANVLFRERTFVVIISDTENQSQMFLGDLKAEL